MKILMGLGNPEDQYVNTRHNLGFEVIDALAHHFQVEASAWQNSKKFKALIAKAKSKNDEFLLVKPQTYMNLSGLAAANLVQFYKLLPQDLIVIHDDLDIKLGEIKVRQGGGTAGHHGVESIIQKLGTPGFVRLRLGIGTPATTSAEHHAKSVNIEHFVLEPFQAKEKSKVKAMIKRAVQAIDTLSAEGLAAAQTQYN